MRLRLERFSYRFAEQVLNSKLTLKAEIENVLTGPDIDISSLSRPGWPKLGGFSYVQKGCYISSSFQERNTSADLRHRNRFMRGKRC